MNKASASNQGVSVSYSWLRNHWVRYAWGYGIALSVSLIMSCTSESDLTLTSSTTQQNVTDSISSPAGTPVAINTGGSSNVPNKPSSDFQASGITALYADTDGDEFPEQIEICDRSKLCILHQSSSLPNTYSQAGWADIYLVGVENIDGERGDEVIVLARTLTGQLLCLCVIHERTGGIQSYSDPAWHTISIAAITDTDGEPGLDIVFIAHDEWGVLQCVCVVHDRQGSYKAYNDLTWKSARIEWLEDTDAEKGKEIVVEARGAADEFRCVCVIHDRDGTVVSYSNPSWRTSTIYKIADTDEYPGDDIILAYKTDAEEGVAIIHDPRQEISTYGFSGAHPAIQRLIYDGTTAKGADLCVVLDDPNGSVVIRDKSHEVLPVQNCPYASGASQ